MKNFALLLLSVAFLFSCGGNENSDIKQTMDAINNMGKLADAAQNVEDHQKVAAEKIAARKAKGDTLAVHFEKLQAYLPSSISGYTPEKPYGQSVNMGGFSFSEASRKFVKKNSDGSEDYIEVKLVDYNQAYEIYSGLTIWISSGMSVENSDGYERGFKPGPEYVYGWEKYSKGNKNAEIFMAIGFRFLLSIESNNQNDTETLKSIANGINLKELAAM